MKKTSVYLDGEQAQRLKELAEAEGRPQAQVLREAIAQYTGAAAPRGDRDFQIFRVADKLAAAPPPRGPEPPDRDFLCAAIAEGPGGSIADIPEEELLKGFGE